MSNIYFIHIHIFYIIYTIYTFLFGTLFSIDNLYMIFLHIDSSSNNANVLNTYIKEGKKVFILFYMEGCGPCNATRPEWKKIENVLKNKYSSDTVIADVEQSELSKIKYLTSQPRGFPTMLYISNYGKSSEDYEDSNIKNKDRTIDSFVEWIDEKQKSAQKGGKWSKKYKKSIRCSHPKGFSQKQYCKSKKSKKTKKSKKPKKSKKTKTYKRR